MTAGCPGPAEAVVTLVLDCGRAVRGAGLPPCVRTGAAPLPRRRAGPGSRSHRLPQHGLRALRRRTPAPRSLLPKTDGSRDPPNRQSEALEMTEIWPPEGATAHFLAVSMCRVTLDTAIDTFAPGSYACRERGAGTVPWRL